MVSWAMLMHITADQLVDTLRSEGLRITEARRAVCAVIADEEQGILLGAADPRREGYAYGW